MSKGAGAAASSTNRRGRRERRRCKTRVRYPSAEAARAEARRLVREHGSDRAHQSYECTICGGWHISGTRR